MTKDSYTDKGQLYTRMTTLQSETSLTKDNFSDKGQLYLTSFPTLVLGLSFGNKLFPVYHLSYIITLVVGYFPL